MEKDYVSIQKASGYVCACANMLYQRVKTKGNVKYLKCSHENCDGSACASACTLSIMHNNNNFCFTLLVTLAFHSYWSRIFHPCKMVPRFPVPRFQSTQ